MFENLQLVKLRYEEMGERLSDPSVLADQEKWQKLNKEHASLEAVVQTYDRYLSAIKDLQDAEELLEMESDPELKTMAREEIDLSKERIGQLEHELKILLLPKDPNDEKNVFVEIRAGAGGDEASLFAGEIYRMYVRYAERRGWRSEMESLSENGLGGIKEVVFQVEGDNVYSRMKYESGVHRVQRVPVTESGGRIHTSTITVAVMSEVDDVAEIDIDPNDLRIDIFRSSGAGGQKVNKTSSAIRITHLPTGIVVQCQNERSQYQNKDKAMAILRARLYDIEQAKLHDSVASDRRSQVGTGDRSEKIRTYNFPQTRVTDHRIKYTSHRLEQILDGDLDEIIDRLIEEDQSRKLAESGESK